MSITIRPLVPADAEAFVALFDAMPFEHAREWKSCYCRYYQTEGDFAAWRARTGADNREDALQAIREGRMHGHLAFDDGLPVGWVNAGEARDFPRIAADLSPYLGDGKTGLTICFVVEPAHRCQGLARALLAAALEGFRSAGYAAALALPVDLPMAGERRYRGTMAMYREAGYVEVGRQGAVAVMRRDLREDARR